MNSIDQNDTRHTQASSQNQPDSQIAENTSNENPDVMSVQEDAEMGLPVSSNDDTYDEPTLENLIKYFKSQNFKAKEEKLSAKTCTEEFLKGIVKKGEYWCLGKVLYVVKKFLPK